MPSRRHSAAIDSSPRRHSSTMRIFSSAEYCLRVARRMSLMTCSDGAFPVPDFCLIFAPLKGYDEPEILRSQLSRFGPMSADAGQVHKREPRRTRLSRRIRCIGTTAEVGLRRLALHHLGPACAGALLVVIGQGIENRRPVALV